MTWVGVAVAGALGAICRYLVDRAVGDRAGRAWPWGTTLVNVTGSLLAGVVAGLAAGGAVSVDVEMVVAGGFLGAYTTFSTAMHDVLRLLEDRAGPMALAALLLPLVVSVLAAGLGWALVA